MPKKIKNFAENIAEVEAIISHMEAGDLALEEMLAQYAKGVQILSLCRSQLNEAETKIKAVKEGGDSVDER